MVELKATNPEAAKPSAPVIDSATPSNSSSSANTQRLKKSGYQTNNEYVELRYLTNPIRGLLIKS
ncbi:hypothetical protein [Polynucleobacter necessarius]|uniref:hypothetical protein n=1 Tax=Polynucleobacter necessarius TaxID=576610 RepID=UPI001E2B63E0|nr:hypothetical protein [Polynucleobacter necessarius]